MKKLMKKAMQFAAKSAVPMCAVIAAVGMFVANSATSFCWGCWAYEEDMPEALRTKC